MLKCPAAQRRDQPLHPPPAPGETVPAHHPGTGAASAKRAEPK